MGRRHTHRKSRFKRKAIPVSTAQGAAAAVQARPSRSSQGLCPPEYPPLAAVPRKQEAVHGSRTLRARASVWAGQEGSPKSRDDCGTSSAGSAGPPPAVPTPPAGWPRVAPSPPAGAPTPVMLSPPCRAPPKQCQAPPFEAAPKQVPAHPAQSPYGLPARSWPLPSRWCRPFPVCGAPAPVCFSSCPAEMGPPRGSR